MTERERTEFFSEDKKHDKFYKRALSGPSEETVPVNKSQRTVTQLSFESGHPLISELFLYLSLELP